MQVLFQVSTKRMHCHEYARDNAHFPGQYLKLIDLGIFTKLKSINK